MSTLFKSPFSALMDSGTNVLLALSTHISGIVFLNECTPDTYHSSFVNYGPSYAENFHLAALDPALYPQWTWSIRNRIFGQTNPSVLNDALIASSRLAMSKLDTIVKIMGHLSQSRYSFRTGIEFQETVYLTKKIQAQRFKDLNYDEARILEFPYILQYSDFAGVSCQQAADDILFKAKLDDDGLAKSELLRLEYFKRVKTAKNSDELPEIYAQFIRDCYTRAHT